MKELTQTLSHTQKAVGKLTKKRKRSLNCKEGEASVDIVEEKVVREGDMKIVSREEL